MSRARVSPFVVDAVDEFLRTKRAREPKTHAAHRGVLLGSERGTKRPLGTPLAPYFQNRRVHTLTRDEISGWFAQRVRGGAQDTKHRVSKNARAFLRFCREQGYTAHDLAGAIDSYRAGRGRVNGSSGTMSTALSTPSPSSASRSPQRGCSTPAAASARR